tara:strand:+ start:172 stop:423 length:252 start_codon:yes stop_codon:yes gene_type:complete
VKKNDVVVTISKLLEKVIEGDVEISAQTAFVKDLNLESIQVIEFLCEVEDSFDIVIGEDKLSDVSTVVDLASVVVNILEEKKV